MLNAQESKSEMYPKLEQNIQQAIGAFDQINAQRKQELADIANFVQENINKNDGVKLTFICTHNSRRSHISQIWAKTAAAFYGIPNVETYSGGTEATAFNPRAVAALERAGFKIDKTTEDGNPIYHIRYADDAVPMTSFSKVYNDAPNPTEGFCAVMTCSSADEACPVVFGAAHRVAIPYEDPKVADNTPEEAAIYDERCRQICREMLYLFSLVK